MLLALGKEYLVVAHLCVALLFLIVLPALGIVLFMVALLCITLLFPLVLLALGIGLFVVGMVNLCAYHRTLFMKIMYYLIKIKVKYSHLEIQKLHHMLFQIVLPALEIVHFTVAHL